MIDWLIDMATLSKPKPLQPSKVSVSLLRTWYWQLRRQVSDELDTATKQWICFIWSYKFLTNCQRQLLQSHLAHQNRQWRGDQTLRHTPHREGWTVLLLTLWVGVSLSRRCEEFSNGMLVTQATPFAERKGVAMSLGDTVPKPTEPVWSEPWSEDHTALRERSTHKDLAASLISRWIARQLSPSVLASLRTRILSGQLRRCWIPTSMAGSSLWRAEAPRYTAITRRWGQVYTRVHEPKKPKQSLLHFCEVADSKWQTAISGGPWVVVVSRARLSHRESLVNFPLSSRF